MSGIAASNSDTRIIAEIVFLFTLIEFAGFIAFPTIISC